MINQKLKVIPKPEERTRTVLKPKNRDSSVTIKGSGKLNLVCGKCGAILAREIHEGQIKNIVLFCNKCDSYNDTGTGVIQH